MTRVLVWKEVREQWPVWLALVVVATGAAAGLASLITPGPNRDEMLTAVLWLTAWGYGLVCGALLLAGETEGATQPFLDSLPGTRPRIWRVKAATGLALLAAQFAALVAVGFLLFSQRYGQSHPVFDLAGMLVCGVFGYAWGLYCGSFASNVLGAIARAMMLQVAWAAVLYLVVGFAMMLYAHRVDPPLQATILLGALGLSASGLAVRSRSIYCLPDRLRAEALRPRRSKRPWSPWGEALFEAVREARWFALGMAIYGLTATAVLPFLGVASWPALTLVIGVFCGVTAFAGERGWLLRSVVRFAIGVAATGIATLSALVPYALRTDLESAGVRNFFLNRVAVSAVSALATDPTLFLAFWPVLGFACGWLAGLLFRRRLSAVAAGLAWAALFGGVWLPSVYVGGQMHAWELWAVPIVLLLATVVLARARTAGRLTAARTVVVTAAALLTAGGGTAAALGHRAVEMPPVPDAVDVEALVAGLPRPDDNRGGDDMSNALLRLSVIERTFDNTQPLPERPDRQPPVRRQFFVLRGDADRVTFRGWKAAEPGLASFLDAVFREPWARDLAAAAELPPGPLLDLRNVTAATPLPQYQSASTAATLLTARALQRQDGGDPGAFVDNLRTGLAVIRNMRQTPVAIGEFITPGLEGILCRGVERWLERLDGRPDLLRRSLEALRQHLDEPPADIERIRRTQFLVTLNTFADPANISRAGQGADPFFRSAFNDTSVLQLALAAPWERIRYRRVLDGLLSSDPKVRSLAKELAPHFVNGVFGDFIGTTRLAATVSNPRHLYPCRVAALQVALRLYREETGRPAEKLTDLVPKYLPAVPLDPYDGQPFRYRLSRGETLDWPPEDFQFGQGQAYDPRPVPAGQGILWSVGADNTDDGGHAQEWPHPNSIVREKVDRIALVPLPPGGP
jgi:hypothetical protein